MFVKYFLMFVKLLLPRAILIYETFMLLNCDILALLSVEILLCRVLTCVEVDAR